MRSVRRAFFSFADRVEAAGPCCAGFWSLWSLFLPILWAWCFRACGARCCCCGCCGGGWFFLRTIFSLIFLIGAVGGIVLDILVVVVDTLLAAWEVALDDGVVALVTNF